MQIPGYQIVRKISQGGMSSVYLAIQQSIGREVALKVMSPALAQDTVFNERFQREANIVGQLSHPNIISIYDIGSYRKLSYIAMDYLAAGSLSARLRKGMSSLEAMRILKQLAAALAHAHSKGYVHRDIKPENILFRGDDTAVLTDFGVAKALNQNLGMTNAGTVLGTPYYMSPEQAKGQPCDGRSDLYGLGVVFFEMLTGKLPYQAEEAVAIAIKHLTAPIPTLPAQFAIYQGLLEHLLAKDPDERVQSGDELIEHIEHIEASMGIISPNSKNPTGKEDAQLGISQLSQTLFMVSWQKFVALFKQESSMNALSASGEQKTTLVNQTAQTTTGTPEHGEPRTQRKWLPYALLTCLALSVFALYTQRGINIATDDTGDQEAIIQESAKPNTHGSSSTEQVAKQAIKQQADVKSGTVTDQTVQLGVLKLETNNVVVSKPEALVTLKLDTSELERSDAENPDENQTNLVASKTKAQSTDQLSSEDQKNSAQELGSYPLTINSQPAADRIRILNIKPRYHAGILLSPGNYLIDIHKQGYEAVRRWVKHSEARASVNFILKKSLAGGYIFSDSIDQYNKGPELVVIPKGQFTMGSKANANSLPLRAVTIGKDFAVSRYEVSFSDFSVYLNSSSPKTTDTDNTADIKATPKPSKVQPDDNKWGRGSRPVINISWDDAVAYSQWLSRKTGQHYRLLTEAEWEYMARAQRAGDYWWPSNSRRMANCRRGCNSQFATLFGSSTAPAGFYPANAFGVHDSAGNVAEWVEDCYIDHYLGASADASPRKTEACLQRSVRGGSHLNNMKDIASHSRRGASAHQRSSDIGFRLLREL